MLRQADLYLETWGLPSKLYKRRMCETLSHSAESRGRGRRYQIGELSINYFRTFSKSFAITVYYEYILISNRIVIIHVRFNIIGYRCILPR